MQTHPQLAVKATRLLVSLLPAIEIATVHDQAVNFTANQYREIEELRSDIQKRASLKLQQTIMAQFNTLQTEKAIQIFGIHVSR
jgi:hypothetical protein